MIASFVVYPWGIWIHQPAANCRELGSGHDRWIGGNDEVQENYILSDGSSFSYENWRSGEPNNDGHGDDPENCAEIEDDGRWDDQPCDKTKRYICERRAAGSP